MEIEPWKQIVGMFYGTYSSNWMYFNGALWFIPCLFLMELIYWPISAVKQDSIKGVLVLLLYFVGILYSKHLSWLPPFGFCSALLGIVYYWLGCLCKPFCQKTKNMQKTTKCFFLFCCLLHVWLQLLLLPITGADLAVLEIKSVWTYIPISVLGIIMYLFLSCVIESNFIIEWLGRNSLVIFALQEPVYRAVIFVGSKIMNYDTELYRCNIICCIFTTIITVLIIYPFIIGYNKLIVFVKTMK